MQRVQPALSPLAASPAALDQKVLAVGSEAPTMMAPAPISAALPDEMKSTVVSPEPHLIAPVGQPDSAPARPPTQALNFLTQNAHRYTPVRQLGEGGMGEVVLSMDSAIGRKVAVKRMKHRTDIEAANQFMAEVQTTGQLEHPGIVPIYDAGKDDEGNPYFVMKCLSAQKNAAVSRRFQGGHMAPSGDRSCARRAPTSSPGITLGSSRSPGGPRWET